MVRSITPEALAELLRSGSAAPVVLDVREPDEREAARIEPSVHIPMQEIPSRLSEFPRDRPLVVYCHHGRRSAMVAGYLEHAGFSDVSNLTGGIDAWSLRVDPAVPRYG
jgi:rhodanese-related sulfurtransferase